MPFESYVMANIRIYIVLSAKKSPVVATHDHASLQQGQAFIITARW